MRILRVAPLLAAVLLGGCADRDRGGLGPRGTALPPPEPAAEGAPAAAPPARPAPEPVRRPR